MKSIFSEYSDVVLTVLIGSLCMVLIGTTLRTDIASVMMASRDKQMQNDVLATKPMPEIIAENRRVRLGSNIDLMEGVTATNGTGTSITPKVIATSDIDKNVKGRYMVHYEVENNFGRKSYKRIFIIVD